MAENTSRPRVFNYRSAEGKAPDSKNIEHGEIAVGFKKGQEALYIKNDDGEVVDFIRNGIKSVTYAELVALCDNKGLTPSSYYRITDFVTTVANDENARSAGHPFDLIVLATDVDVLQEECYAIEHEGDTYFEYANLAAWKVWYSLDNDADRYAWADTENGKGVIHRLIDEFGNDCPYDFKNVQFKRWAVTEVKVNNVVVEDSPFLYTPGSQDIRYGFQGSDISFNVTKLTVDPDDSEFYYTFSWVNEDGEVQDASILLLTNDESQCPGVYENVIGHSTAYGVGEYSEDTNGKLLFILNKNVFVAASSYDGNIFYGVFGNRIGTDSYQNTFGNGCINNTFGNGVRYNTFGNNCYWNTFGNNCYWNTFGNEVYYNSFGNNVQVNSFGNGCINNTFGNYVRYNTFGNDCGNNTFGNDCGNNTFGNNCYWNTFGNNVQVNSFGNYCEGNTFGNYVWYNTFGNEVYYNSFGNGCNYNAFANNFQYNTLGEGIKYISVPVEKVQYVQILNGTQGTSSSKKLDINFNANTKYSQFAGFDSNNDIQVWVSADCASHTLNSGKY